jgi:PAS domain S-box-containing protein
LTRATSGHDGDKTTRTRTGVSGRVLNLSPATRYGVALAAALGAIALRLALDPVWGIRLPFITLFPAIMLSAWLGGLWPGVMTTLICGTAAAYFWIEPARSWAIRDWNELLGTAVFFAIGVVISALNEAWRRGAATVAESEERLRVTLTSIGDAVITTDEDGRVTHLNAIAEHLTAWSAADATGRPLREVFVIINEQSRQPAQNPVDRVLHEGILAGLANHTLLVSKDGREIPIDDSAAPIRTGDGRMAGVVMVFRDVTERRRTEREREAFLERERAARRDAELAAQQLQTALEAGRMGAWDYAVGTGTIRWSPGLEAIHGFEAGTFPGTLEAFRREIHPADRDRVLEAIRTAVEERRDQHIEYRITRPDGAVRWVEGRGRLYCDENGRPEGMAGVCFDVTERKAAEESQRRTREQATFLSEASARLARSLDYEETLKAIAALAVPAVADWCAVDIVNAAGEIGRLAVAHIDPAKVELGRIVQERYPEDPQSPYGVYQVLRTGAPVMMSDIPDELLVQSARDPEHLRILRELGLRSYICVPMIGEARTLGVLTFVTEGERRYTEADLGFAEQIAVRAALAIANARAYEEARRLGHELKLAQERVTQLVESVPGVVWEAWGQPDAAMQRIDFVSGYVETMLGYSVEEWLRTPNFWLTIVHPDDREQAARVAAAAFASRQPHTNQFRWIAKDGRVLWVEARATVIHDASGNPVGMRGVTFDITERKQVLAREQAARQEIERASRLKDEFLAVLSHELRTPLNAVLGYAHLLGSGALAPGRTKHALEAIERNAQAQSRLVESLLDLSRVMAGKLELNLEQVNLARVVDSAVDVIRPEAEAKRITLEVAPPPRDVTLVGDGSRLQQVFWNLLTNAVKFTPVGGRVGIRCLEEDARVRVLVTDTGQGISADFLPYVFDRFSQADSHKRHATTGLGLGLALVREMVQAHGGSVAAESPGDGHGSTFTVTLPLSIGTATALLRTAFPEDEPESLPPIEVLIVDDEADGRELLALLLESRGAVARSVSSASEALDAMSQRRPDVLLADLRMPGEDGYSLIRRVRARERERQERPLPAIAVTAYASPRDRDQALAAGYDAHVAKPVDPRELARAVASVTRGIWQRDGAV